MDIRRLRNFIRVIDLGSITRASVELNIAQPALSQQIMGLEAEFKKKLLLRSRRGVSPTEAGAALYRHAHAIQSQYEQLCDQLLNSGDSLKGIVRIGLPFGSAATVLGLPILTEVRKRYKDLFLIIQEGLSGALRDDLAAGRLDMVVLYDNPDANAIESVYFVTEALYLICAKNSLEGNGSREEIPLRELNGMEFILPNEPNSLRDLIEKHFNMVNVKPRVVAQLGSLQSVMSSVKAGVAASVVPLSVAQSMSHDSGVVALKIVEPCILRPVLLCRATDLPMTESAQAVFDLVCEIARDLCEARKWPGAVAGDAEEDVPSVPKTPRRASSI